MSIEYSGKTEAEARAYYDDFIRSGLAAGFTDSQIDWLWERLSTFRDNYFLPDSSPPTPRN